MRDELTEKTLQNAKKRYSGLLDVDIREIEDKNILKEERVDENTLKDDLAEFLGIDKRNSILIGEVRKEFSKLPDNKKLISVKEFIESGKADELMLLLDSPPNITDKSNMKLWFEWAD